MQPLNGPFPKNLSPPLLVSQVKAILELKVRRIDFGIHFIKR
jgi:hypothetical protein